jgi:hypothetical protein
VVELCCSARTSLGHNVFFPKCNSSIMYVYIATWNYKIYASLLLFWLGGYNILIDVVLPYLLSTSIVPYWTTVDISTPYPGKRIFFDVLCSVGLLKLNCMYVSLKDLNCL